jgi:endoglucanase
VQLVNEQGQAIQLMGMSSHGLQWLEKCYSKESIQFMVENWGMNVFRAAMYVGEGGYSEKPWLKDTVKNIVQWCKELGIYVLIDWHVHKPGNPNDEVYGGAIPFFQEMATLYKDEKHVIIEICN